MHTTSNDLAGMLHNTVLIVNSDNGGDPCGMHMVGNNHPLRGSKMTYFEVCLLLCPHVSRQICLCTLANLHAQTQTQSHSGWDQGASLCLHDELKVHTSACQGHDVLGTFTYLPSFVYCSLLQNTITQPLPHCLLFPASKHHHPTIIPRA